MSVRFLDPRTNEVVYPEPLQTNAITPHLGTNARVDINPLLAPTALLWDVKSPIETLEGQLPWEMRSKLGQSATRPPSAQLQLQSPHLPWRVQVRPKTPNLFVTVFDVLATLREVLWLEITPGEWGQFSTGRKDRIVAERGARVADYDPHHRVNSLYRHPIRVDTLEEFTCFGGLIPAPGRGPGCLDLRFERRRR